MKALHRGILVATVVFAQVVPVGCSSPVAANDKSLPASRFAAAYAQALCTSLSHCCDENQVTFAFDECTAGFRAFVDARLADPILAANYDSKLAADCVRRVSAAEQVACDPIPNSISDARTVCQQIFAGKKAIGESCTNSAECAPVEGKVVGCEGLPISDPDAGLLPLSFEAKLSPQAEPLTPPQCVAFPPTKPGDRCTTPALALLCQTTEGLFCDSVDGVCKPRGEAGQRCNGEGCKPGLVCSDEVCTPKVGTGEACADNAVCAGLLRCDPSSKKCTDRIRAGESCTIDGDCTLGVCDTVTRRCLRNAIATSATCHGQSAP